MKDPRIIEIEILSKLERDTFVGTFDTISPKGTISPDDRMESEALLHLFFDAAIIDGNYVTGGPPQPPDFSPDPEIPLKRAAQRSVEAFFARQNLNPRITQRGRLRLYRLRDEILNKDKLRDDSGVLWAKRHW